MFNVYHEDRKRDYNSKIDPFTAHMTDSHKSKTFFILIT